MTGVAERTVPAAPAPARRLRRWIRGRRRAAGIEGSAGTVYVAVLTVAMAVALVGEPATGLVWPARPVPLADAGSVPQAALLAIVPLALYALLRRSGPLAVSRADLAWLFLAPVSRRGLLVPGALGVLAGAVAVGLAAAAVAVGRFAARPIRPPVLTGALLVGAMLGVAVALVAAACQRYDRCGRAVDAGAGLLALLLAVPAAGLWRPAAGPAVPAVPAAVAALLAGTVAVLLLGALVATARGLDGLPAHLIRDAAETRGTYLDAAVAAEPAFVVDAAQRRYWGSRTLRSVRLRAAPAWALPLQHDILVVCRRPVRMLALAVGTLAPAVATTGPGWLPAVVVLAGVLAAAGTTTAAVRRDSAEPALLRLLGLAERPALAGRLIVPAVLAAAWAAVALTVPALIGDRPAGPCWALGLALGPAAAVAAIRRARIGQVRHDLMPIETPMGSLATGPLLWLLSGVDLLVLLGSPALLTLLTGAVPDWQTVLVQAALSTAGLVFYATRR
ncbi:DUF6297 family protein [Plantactinospora sp. KBS50]|uniref:DUF6297 family protein n=1 Tax=Plantactinospora sp. KBS50 TaxID=2024580 RepID=UPI000BAAC28B|nr:DUF6297 family protein [Plantactinospora sp. KBS50]ASW53166.1 hypothetical protein CIK06_01700 [Plantactinospora sp. KBS50]